MQIRAIAYLLFFQSFLSCQQTPEKVLPLAEASLDVPTAAGAQPGAANALPSTASIVFRSLDGGQTWQGVSAGLPEGLETQGVFVVDGEVFLGSNDGLYRSNAATAAPVWEQTSFLNGRITGVFPGRAGLYACSYEVGLFQNIPGTDVWQNRSKGLKDKSVCTVLESPAGDLFVGCDKGIFKSADGGQTWKPVYAGGMVLDIVESGGVLIAGGTQGVLRSVDGGERWDLVLDENIMAKKTGLIGDRFVAILGTTDPTKIHPEGITSRLRASADGGKTWQRMEHALLPLPGVYDMDKSLSEVLDIFDIVQVGDYLLCSFDTGIYRSADQGKSWELVFPTNDKGSFNLAVSGRVIYAVPGGGC